MASKKPELEPGCKVIAFPGNKIQIVLTPKLLGKGQYGSVHYGYLRDNPNKYYAVKVIDRKRIKGKNHELLVNEIEIMTEIQHKNVVGLIAGTKTQTNYYLVMEFCNGGDVDGFLKARRGYLSEIETRLILKQLVQGLMAIQAQNVMHRDLKLANIMMSYPHLTREQILSPDFQLKEFVRDVQIASSTDGGSSQPIPFQVKIADLGFARKLEVGNLAETRLGTPLVMAPEVLDGNKYDHTADVWSLGCIFYEMLTGYAPFTGTSQSNLSENIARGHYYFPKTCKLSLQGLSFLNSCLQYDQSMRPNLQELLNHPYIALEDSLEVSTEQDLFLSFHPSTRRFGPDANDANNGAGLLALDGTNEANITQDEVLKHPRGPYEWMKSNPSSVIQLSVHGNQQYEKVVMERLMKNETKRQEEEEENRRKRRQAAEDDVIPELSDEELNEEIRQQLADVKKQQEREQQLLLEDAEEDLESPGDKHMVETQYLIPARAGQAEIRLSQHPNMIGSAVNDDDSEGFQSAFACEQRPITQQQVQLKPDAAAVGGLVPAAETFNTHTIDTSLPAFQLNSDLIEEAKQEAQQKAATASISQSQSANLQAVARQIRAQDEQLFGGASEVTELELDARQKSSSMSDIQEHRQAAINEFVGGASQSAMQSSVVDMTRDMAFMLARDADGIIVENFTPSNRGPELTQGTLEIELDYF